MSLIADRDRIGPSVLAFVIAMVLGADIAATAATASSISVDTGLGSHSFLVVVIASAVSGVVAAILVGYLADIYPTTTVMEVLLIEVGIITLAAAFASRGPVYAAARISSAMAEAAAIPVLLAVLAGTHPVRVWPRSFAYLVAGVALGLGLGVTVAPIADHLISWRFVIGPLGLAALALAWPSRGLPRLDVDADLEHPGFTAAFSALWGAGTLPVLLGATFILGAGALPLVSAVPRYLSEVAHTSGQGTALVGIIMGAAALLGALAGGAFGNGHNPASGRGQGFYAGYALVLGAIGVLGAAFTVPSWAIDVGLVTASAALGAALPLLFQAAALLMPPEVRAQGFGVLIGALLAGGVIGAYSIGLIPGLGGRAEVAVLAVVIVVGGAVTAATATAQPDASDTFRIPARGNLELIGGMAALLLLSAIALGPQAHFSPAPSSDSLQPSPSQAAPGFSPSSGPSPSVGPSPSPSPVQTSPSPSPSPIPSPSERPTPSPSPTPSPTPCGLPSGVPLPTCPPH